MANRWNRRWPVGPPCPRKPDRSARKLHRTISKKTGQRTKAVQAVFTALQRIAYSEVAKAEKFTIPKIVSLKLKHMPARPAGKKMVFGTEKQLAAKTEYYIVKAVLNSTFRKVLTA